MDCKEGLFDIGELGVNNHLKDFSINSNAKEVCTYGMTHFNLVVLSGKLVKNTCRVIRYSKVGTVCGQANFERF